MFSSLMKKFGSKRGVTKAGGIYNSHTPKKARNEKHDIIPLRAQWVIKMAIRSQMFKKLTGNAGSFSHTLGCLTIFARKAVMESANSMGVS